MPQKSWAVGEEVLAADFNTYLQNQTVPVFADAAARDTQWAAPPNGAMCIITGLNYALQTRIPSMWYTCFARLGFTQFTGPTGAVGTTETIIGSSITVTVPANRLIRLECGFRAINASAAGNAGFLRIKEAAATLMECQVSASSSLGGAGGMIGRTVTPSAGAHTYGLALAAGAGTVTLYADPTYPCWLEARDVGAA